MVSVGGHIVISEHERNATTAARKLIAEPRRELGLHRAGVVYQITRHYEVRVVLVSEVHESMCGAKAKLAAAIDPILAWPAVSLKAMVM